MGNTPARKQWPWWAIAPLFAVVLGTTLISPAQQPKPDVLYYRRVAIDTDASHDSTDPVIKKLLEVLAITESGPGELEVKFLQGDLVGSYWRIQPAAGKAASNGIRNSREGTLQVTWSVPPEYLTAGADLTLWISVTATRKDAEQYVVGGAQFHEYPVGNFEYGAEKTVVGNNPFGFGPSRVSAGLLSDWVPKADGRITLRPKKNEPGFFIGLWLNPGGGESLFNVHFHYEPL